MSSEARTLVVVAHPDDETLAFFAQIARDPDCAIAHATDGSPYDLANATAAGYASRESYAAARRAELQNALALLGGRETFCFGYVDQETWRDLRGLIRDLQALIARLRPKRIFTHPYEGGHPDHDSLAFAVSRVLLRTENRIEHQEGAFYHRQCNALRTGTFLRSEQPVTDVWLDPEALQCKQRMLNCFASQQRVLSLFNPETELYREAPVYDFRAAPHDGPLHYETLGWRVTGSGWRAAVRDCQEA